MQQILSNTFRRRSFFIIAILLIGCATLVRYFFLPQYDSTLSATVPQFFASFVERLLTSFIVTVLIGLLIFWLEPGVVRRANMSTVDPKEISILLRAAIEPTEKWWFRGGTGRYLRAMTLPEMGKLTRDKSSGKELHVQLIDPRNEFLCEQYANYRRGLHSAKAEEQQWTVDRVRIEVYATILSLFVKAGEYPLLNIHLTLLPLFSSFRLDLSSQYVILTKEDSRAAGLRCDSESEFYIAYRDDLLLTARQGKEITMKPIRTDLNVTSVRHHFADLGLALDSVTDEFLQSIIKISQAPVNPYA